MDLKSFVSETLLQVLDGVREAQEKHGGGLWYGRVSPQFELSESTDSRSVTPITAVNFDVAITVSDDVGKKGGIAVVGGFISVGAQGESKNTNQSVSRITFTVPVLLPGVRE